MIDPDELKPLMRKMITEWKIMVFYRKMTVTEYEQRREALNEMMRRLGATPVQSTGWVALRKMLREKDPDLKVPEEIKDRCYRGKW